MNRPNRRTVIAAGLGSALLQPLACHATPEAQQAAMAAFAGGRAPRDGRVTLVIDPLVENGNAVPVSVKVDSPMTAADHVRRIGLFTPGNPQPEVGVFHLGPASGRAEVSLRMRMATTQSVTALALMSDGSVWRASVHVVVTLAACLEGE